MTHDGKHPDDAALDDLVRAYETAEFKETPPPRVDQEILEQAAKQSSRQQRRFTFKPAYAAWAAVLVLSVSLVLELTLRTPFLSTSPLSTPPLLTPPVPTDAPESSAATSASDSAPPAADEAPAPAAQAEDSVSASSSRGAPEAAQRSSLRQAVPAVREAQVDRDVEGAAESATNIDDSSPAAQAERAVTAAAQAAEAACTARERETPEQWFICLARLRDNASGASFGAELDAFVERHPDYILPPQWTAEATPGSR